MFATQPAKIELRDHFASTATEDDIHFLIPLTGEDCFKAVYGEKPGNPTNAEINEAVLILRCKAKYRYADTMLKVRDL